MNREIALTEDEQIRQLKFDMEREGISLEDKDRLSEKVLKLTLNKRKRVAELDNMRKRMHEAAEIAEKSGVGTGGKGSPDD